LSTVPTHYDPSMSVPNRKQANDAAEGATSLAEAVGKCMRMRANVSNGQLRASLFSACGKANLEVYGTDMMHTSEKMAIKTAGTAMAVGAGMTVAGIATTTAMVTAAAGMAMIVPAAAIVAATAGTAFATVSMVNGLQSAATILCEACPEAKVSFTSANKLATRGDPLSGYGPSNGPLDSDSVPIAEPVLEPVPTGTTVLEASFVDAIGVDQKVEAGTRAAAISGAH